MKLEQSSLGVLSMEWNFASTTNLYEARVEWLQAVRSETKVVSLSLMQPNYIFTQLI